MPKLKNLVCRTCLQTNKVIYLGIFEHYKQEKLLSDMLRECTAVQVDRFDCLPLYMCNDCIEELISAWKFKTMVVESDLKLRRNDILQKNAKRFIIDKCSNANDTLTKSFDNSSGNQNEINVLTTTTSDFMKTPSNTDENVNVNDLDNKECIEISSESYEDNPERTFQKNEFPFLDCDGKRDEDPRMKRGLEMCEIKDQFEEKFYQIPRRRHITEKSYNCTFCKQSFPLQCKLQKHLRTHRNEGLYKRNRQYLCNVCGKRFGKIRHFETHLQKHSFHRAYFCKICNTAFASLGALCKHKHNKNESA